MEYDNIRVALIIALWVVFVCVVVAAPFFLAWRKEQVRLRNEQIDIDMQEEFDRLDKDDEIERLWHKARENGNVAEVDDVDFDDDLETDSPYADRR